MPTLIHPPTIALDSTGIGSDRVRTRVLASFGSTGVTCRSVTDFWDSLSRQCDVRCRSEPTVVMADLSHLVRGFRSTERPRWMTVVRTSRPYFLAFVRTERDRRCASAIDDLMRHCDQRLTVCGDPVGARELESCVNDALAAHRPDSIADLRYVRRTESFWIEFSDGFVSGLTLEALGIGDLRDGLVLEAATLTDWGQTLVLMRLDGTPFEIDSASIRAALDADFAGRLVRQAAASDETLGARVRAARKARGLTQAQLGAAAGFDQAVISKLERGRHEPRIDTLSRIAEALGTSVGSLLAQR
jgi:DNA-binding XRE family transcriptional regulator